MEQKNKISNDYIRGLVEGEGTFTFSTNLKLMRKVPAFSIKMHIRDKKLLEEIRDALGLRNRIYEYNHQSKKGPKRAPQAMLIVREFGQLKNIIIPFFNKKLHGNKAYQFEDWIKRIDSDPFVSGNFKFLSKLYNSGFYDRDRNPRYD